MSPRIPGARYDRSAKTPFDQHAWPEQLTARVVSPGESPRVHGYEIDRDLARHYRFSDVILLSLTGELPAEAQGRVFEIALSFLAPISIAEAPSHAAVLARICDGSTSSVIGAGAIALGEQARSAIAAHASFLDTLDRGEEEAGPPSDDPGVRALAEALAEISVSLPAVERAPSRAAAILAAMHACGLRRHEQLEAAWVTSRIAVVAAEALATPATSFREYPLNTPPVRYEEDE